MNLSSILMATDRTLIPIIYLLYSLMLTLSLLRRSFWFPH
jgi:hypothetical protein